MVYDTIERSNASGKPVGLYEFIYGTATWRYCAYPKAIVVGGQTYEPLVISDSGYSMSGEPADDMVTIKTEANIPVSIMLNGSAPSETIWVNIRRYHHGDTEAPIMWVGYIAARKLVSSIEAEFKCKMLTAGFDRDGARLTYGRGCPYSVYDQDCKVNKALFALTTQVTGLSGNSVICSGLSGLPSGYLANGFFEWSRFSGALERRAIDTHATTAFAVLGSTVGIEVGNFITVYPGCGRTRNDCAYKFNNLSNYGGFAHLPGKSPFSGDPVF